MAGEIVEFVCAGCERHTHMVSQRPGSRCKHCGGELIAKKAYRISDNSGLDSVRTLPNTLRKYTQREAQEQELLFDYIAFARCSHPELELLFHIPNGGSRDEREAANLKKQGVRAGVPDLLLPVPRGGYHGLFIELKAGKNKPQEKQIEWLVKLSEQGYCVAVCYGWERAVEVIIKYLKGEPKHDGTDE